MKKRKPKDLARKASKPLKLQYSEVLRLREMVRQTEAEHRSAQRLRTAARRS
jgi:hypothetical protein